MLLDDRAQGTLRPVEVCTIIAKNYLAHARVLARSLAEHNPESRLWTLIIDDFSRYVEPDKEPFEVLSPADIGCEPFTNMALRYTVLELSTAVKPWLLRHLMDETGGPVTYLDPDIKVYGPLRLLDELAAEHGVALIPHNNEPLPPDGRKPSQIDIMIAGVYNLGYVSLAPRPEVEHLLDWWADRLRRDCRVDPVWGYFVDQRWFDLVPGFLTDFAIVREPEYNLAYWNLHSRRLEHDGERYRVNGHPLAFFHFSGFDPEHPLSLSRHQDRIDVTAHPVLERLLREYAAEVMAEGHAVSRKWPYSYVALGDGTEIDELVRSLCEQFDDEQEELNATAPSPFTAAGARAFHAWLSEDAPGAPPGVNRLVARIYDDRRDLQEAFPDLLGEDRERLLSWARELGPREVPLLAKVATTNGALNQDATAPSKPSTAQTAARAAAAPLPDGPWGVNVVGYFHSEDELGETARQLVDAFDTAGIPSVPVADWTTPVTSAGRAYSTLPPEAAPYPVNLVCSAPDALMEFAAHAGQGFFAGHYSIGLWLAELAPSTDHLTLLQELWAPSAHTAAVLTASATVPVKLVPIPVQPPPFEVPSRTELGWPTDRFLFMFSFDPAEGIERKNPLAVIEAFGRAFEAPDPVALVINCTAAANGSDGLEEIRAAAAERPAVQLIDGPMGRATSIGLTALCDCYVSLHRAEAFGLSIAEAMWLSKPVIATGYSGNLDYMTPANSLLVDHQAIALGGGTGEDFAGRNWAEPDLEHAAALMRRVFEDPAAARVLGERAAADIRRTHSPAVAAQAIARRLESIRVTGRGPRALPSSRVRPAALARVDALVRQGPPPVPRLGAARRVRGAIRKAILRAMRPYTDYQQKANGAVIDAVEELHSSLASVRREATTERAQLLAELRGSRQLRSALDIQARGVDELRRIVGLQGDRALYLALAELGRRHEAVGPQAGEPHSSLGLAAFELRGYSQNGEDGLLAEILRRIGTENRFFVEFGVESGVEGNCVYLADVAGWNGLFMEADDQMYRLLERKYAARPGVRTIRSLVTPENIEQLLEEANVPTEPDVMSIDVDGQDYWIWEALARYCPRAIVIEYNSALDPRRRLVQPKESGAWDGTEYFGASLGAMRSLGERKGYRLVHTELAGSNAFFVREDLAEGRFQEPDQVPLRGVPNYFQSGYRHPPDERDRRYLDLDSGLMVQAPTMSRDAS